jgi:fructan beta-fructosidase
MRSPRICRAVVAVAVLVTLLLFPPASTRGQAAGQNANPATDQYRPLFHFSPAQNWTNDPNGLVFDGREYHLFFQYNPFGDHWGHMSWGHAVSKDLMAWEELPVALKEENGIMMFSGSAVVDSANSSGFGVNGEAPLVAIYTGHTPTLQTQNIAYSTDHGRTWTKYAKNPVIDIGEADFRDPMVFWPEPTRQWVMVISLAKQYKVRFYSSADLKNWKLLSEFGPAGATGVPNWECPNIFELPVANAEGTRKWVLLLGSAKGGPAGGSATQYFVGEFDGTKFVTDNPADKTLWVDYGADFYAAQTWSGIPASDGRRIVLAWMSNWDYADQVPTSPWRGQMTLPRTLGLLRTKDGVRLTQAPVREIESMRGEHIQLHNARMADAEALLSHGNWPTTLEIVAKLKVPRTGDVGFTLRQGPAHGTRVGYDAKRRAVYLDRTHSGKVVTPQFAARHEEPVEIRNDILELHIVLDQSSVELFANDGLAAITDLIFPDPSDLGLATYYDGEAPQIISLDVWKLRSKWEVH